MSARRLAVISGSFLLATAAGLSQAAAWEMRVCADPSILPFSDDQRAGFENRIAEVMAADLGAEITFLWWPQAQTMFDDQLRQGNCDIVMGVPDGQGGVLTTISYYRSPFVFVYRTDDPDHHVNMFDDPRLRTMEVGVQPADGPAYNALQVRNLGDNITREFQYLAGTEEPLRPAFDAVKNGEVDVVITWGPAAGYYAGILGNLTVAPVDPPFEPPFIPMFINMAIAVRIGDESLRDLLDLALADTWPEIYAILDEYHVPYMDLPRPTRTIEGP
ncbi:MAG: transporter substrate-binding domain-containing protein [Bauldia sp.]|nr:transporter substrate-binding domain-containing protein [Bauldia sp.]